MKKLDKLIFKSFIGPFFLTFCVVVFIFLLQFLLRHFDDIVGKGLSWDIYVRLLAYFSINMTPVSFPLAILLSSLMTYGNLGEHSEITALKGAGISLTRTLVPMFVFSLVVTGLAFFSNNYLVPRANLKAYSLLYDIKQKSPALNIKEGVFYKDIPGYQIKVNKKFKDEKTLKDIIIYDHTRGSGNKSVILADSGKMYTIMYDRYLVMELFDGQHYSEEESAVSRDRGRYNQADPKPYSRNKFNSSKFVFSMAAFDLKRTKEELFAGHFLMKSMDELKYDVDSMYRDIKFAKYESFTNLMAKFNYHLDKMNVPDYLDPDLYGRSRTKDTTSMEMDRVRANQRNGDNNTDFSNTMETGDTSFVQPENRISGTRQTMTGTQNTAETPDEAGARNKADTLNQGFPGKNGSGLLRSGPGENVELSTKRRVPKKVIQKESSISDIGADSILNGKFEEKRILTSAVSNARFVKNHIMVTSNKVNVRESTLVRFELQRLKIFAQAFSCLIMFLVGAPLGSIIKRGGLGFPVIVSIGFFILYYVLMNMGDKWAREGLISPFMGVWLANFFLLPIGVFFLRQARLDARLFDIDFYNVLIDKIRIYLRNRLKNQKLFILFNR